MSRHTATIAAAALHNRNRGAQNARGGVCGRRIWRRSGRRWPLDAAAMAMEGRHDVGAMNAPAAPVQRGAPASRPDARVRGPVGQQLTVHVSWCNYGLQA